MHVTLSRKCNEERQRRRSLEQRERFSEGSKKQQLQEMLSHLKSPSCELYEKFFKRQPY
jgi:hypothetical protein